MLLHLRACPRCCVAAIVPVRCLYGFALVDSVVGFREASWKKKSKKEDEKSKDDEDEDEEGPAKVEDGAHEYECTKCGFTLFVAKGREFKFYGDDFKCTQCGAGKESFKDNSLST